MRNITGWPTDTTLRQPVVEVRHGNKTREIVSVSLSRSLPSSHHAQVAGVGGLTQAVGSVDWASQSDVSRAYPTAFNRKAAWPPKTRDRVELYAGYRTTTGDKLARLFIGTIADNSGDPQSSSSSGYVDLVTRLTRKFTMPPLINNMPPLEPGGPWRGVGLYPTYFTDRAARVGGFFSTPPMASGNVFSAPLMGSAWPERGTLTTGLRYTDRNNANARWHESAWGMGVSDCYLSYTPSGDTTLTRAMEITAMAPAPPFAGRTAVAARWGATDIRLVFNGSGAFGIVDNVTLCYLPHKANSPVTLRVVPNGGALDLTLRDVDGAESVASVATPAGVGSPMSEVRVTSEAADAIIGGAQVAFPATAWATLGYTRTAYITPAAHNATLAASPPLMNISCRELLEEQSRAELAALWIDGDGALHWVNRNRLVAGSPVTKLTSKDHLKNLAWQEEYTAVSYQVEVKGRAPEAVLQSKVPRHEVWRSSYGEVLADGTEVFEELLHPDADEDWIMVDAAFDNDVLGTNHSEGSDVALYFFFASGVRGQAGYTTQEGYERAWASATLTRIDWRTYKLITRVYGVSAGSYERAEFSLKVPSERQGSAPYSWPAGLGGTNFPVIRAYAKVMWTDTLHTALTGASSDAPVLTHDVQWYVQDAAAKQAIADLLAAETATPQPFLSGVGVIADSRLERGDIVTLSDPEITEVEFRCLVVGIKDEFTSKPTRWSQTYDFRVLGYSAAVTLGDVDTAWAGQLLSALDAAHAGDTLAALDNDPLKEAPA